MSLLKTRADVRVFLGPQSGNPVDAELGQVLYLTPTEIVWTPGGEQLNYAKFEYNLALTGEHVENNWTPTGFSRQLEVRLYFDDETFHPLFWGEVTKQRLVVDRSREYVEVQASVFPYHFGYVCDGMEMIPPGFVITVNEDIVFNPMIDGIIEPNKRDDSFTDSNGKAFWGDPESFRTEEAREYQANGGETLPLVYWSLEDAVKTMCAMLNPTEEFIQNPLPSDYFVFDVSAPRPDNLKLPRGKYLPFYLDAILHPYGYDWILVLTQEGTETKKRITFFKRGEGPQLSVTMGAFGADLDLETQNCQAFDVSTDVGSLANKIILEGGRKQYEITAEFYRGWPEADDALTAADLDKSDPDSQYNTADKTLPWRFWVMNEAGDFCGTRTTVAPIPDAPRDWSAFGVLVPRRRELEDCLTYDETGMRRKPFVEWWNPDAGSSGEWEPVPETWNCDILETQMAIMFEGDQPPEELIDAGDDAKLRCTFTITGDERLVETAEKRDESPNGRESVMMLDVSDRYHYRSVCNASGASDPGFGFASELAGDANGADERDDESALETLAEYVRAEEESAIMEGKLTLTGITTTYWIGDLITEINGREISLNRNSEAAATPKYLQVVGISWKPEQQITELMTAGQTIDSWYQPGVRPDGG